MLVTKQGLPIAYDIFPGNEFEWHTIIPVVNNSINKYAVKEFTVVVDAAMISTTNIQELLKNDVNYKIGTRLNNLSNELIERIDDV